jgi:hypothetical protein
VLIGKYAKAAMAGKPAKIATLDLAPGITVGQLRHDGFLKGFGIKEGDNEHRLQRDTQGDQAKGRRRWRIACREAPDINVVYTINEPAAAGPIRRSRARQGKRRADRLRRRRLRRRQERQGRHHRATSQQYPLKMASLGVEAGVDYAKTGKKVSGYTDTGVTLITDKPMNRRRQQGYQVRHGQLLGYQVADTGLRLGPRVEPARPKGGSSRPALYRAHGLRSIFDNCRRSPPTARCSRCSQPASSSHRRPIAF